MQIDPSAIEWDDANNGAVKRAPVPGRKYSVEDAIQELGMTAPEAQQFVASQEGAAPATPQRAGQPPVAASQSADPQASAPDPSQVAWGEQQRDNAAPDGSGFTDDQKRAILDYLPKARDAADLEQFSREVSGGKARIGNADKIIDYLRKGGRPEDFAWQTPTYEAPKADTKAAVPNDSLGNAVLQQLNSVVPGLGTLLQFVGQQDAAKAFAHHAANGAAFDWGPEVGAVVQTALDPAAYSDLGAEFQRNAAHNRATLEGESALHPLASGGGELGGVALTGAATGGAAEAANLGRVARIAQLAGEGGVYGAGAAGPGSRAEGAVTGAVLAPVVPLAVRGAATAANLAKQGADLVREGAPGVARRIIARAIKDDANTPETVGRMIADAQGNGVPLALGDTGENVRGLLAASSRASGAGRTVVRDALGDRQAAMADRVAGHIERDLGPVANPHEVADQLAAKAKADSAPLYDAAYARPGAAQFAQRVAPLLQRPSMKKALAYAYRTAQEEGRNPEELGLKVVKDRTTSILDAQGNNIVVPEVEMQPNPTWQTLDYVKRGADDMIEGYKNKTTGRYEFDTEGNAANNTLRSYLKAFDAANPDYAAARAAYAGPTKDKAAMDLGRKSLNMTADDLEARMRGLSASEREMAKLGVRRAMVELVQSKGDTADVVHALVGTGKKRAMLARLFGDRPAFQRFVDTLGHEREAWRSFQQARLGSPTAANQMDDSTLQAATGAADLVLAGGVPVATATRQAVKFLGRKASKKAQEQIAALLSNTDAVAIRELAAHLRAEAKNRGVNIPRLRMIGGVGGREAAATIAGQERQ